jgi:hypothetical protein
MGFRNRIRWSVENRKWIGDPSWNVLDPQFFRQPHFGFVEDFFQTSEAGEGKAIDRNCTDFADWGLFQRGATAFFVD